MGKLDAIIQNPRLEEHLIYFVGIRHMQEHWEEHIDPEFDYEGEVFELFYEEMKKSVFGGLKMVLKEEAGLTSRDADFKQTLDAAINIIIARHGMTAILEASRAFLHVIQQPRHLTEDDLIVCHAPVVICPVCSHSALPLTFEDIPQQVAESGGYQMGDWVGYCLNCQQHFFGSILD